MIEIGRLCVKTAGRDAKRKCIIIDVLDDKYVIVDGDVRRKKCNIKHLEPLEQVIEIEKGADHKTIVSEFKKLGIEIKETKPKEKKEKPRKIRKAKEKLVEEKTTKTTKKETKEKKPAKKKETKE